MFADLLKSMKHIRYPVDISEGHLTLRNMESLFVLLPTTLVLTTPRPFRYTCHSRQRLIGSKYMHMETASRNQSSTMFSCPFIEDYSTPDLDPNTPENER
jgi:hypothetical protein